MRRCWCGCRPWVTGRRRHDAIHKLLGMFDQIENGWGLGDWQAGK
jgi:hypothetical protein